MYSSRPPVGERISPSMVAACRSSRYIRARLVARRLGPLGHRFHLGKALFHVVAHHLLAVHHQAERLADEIVLARHGPGDGGLMALGLELELRGVRALERLDEIDLDLDELARAALDDDHLPLADLVVAGPGHHRALTRFSSFEADLGGVIDLCPRRPGVPLM